MIRSSGIEDDHEQPSLDSSEALERLGKLVLAQSDFSWLGSKPLHSL